MFPFRFSGQPRAGPLRVGACLEIGEVQRRCLRIERLQPGEGKLLPARLRLMPVLRLGDVLGADKFPAFGEPEFRIMVPPILHEG